MELDFHSRLIAVSIEHLKRMQQVIGIAGGDGTGILFRKGKVVKKFPQEKLVEVLLAEVEKFERNRKEKNGK